MSANDTKEVISSFLVTGIEQLAFIVPFFQIRESEDNVGSALANGYLFAAATPLSISGSLGVLKQGFTFWLLGGMFPKATLHYRRTLLSKKFRYRGEVSSLLNFEKEMGRSKAESRFMERLWEFGIKEPEILKVTHKDKHWKTLAALSSLLAVSCSVTPYIHAIYNLRMDRDLGLAISFPLFRAFGSLLITVSLQYILRYRLLSLIRKRIIFIMINNIARKGGINLGSLLNTGWQETKTSGDCIRNLKSYLDTSSIRNTRTGANGERGGRNMGMRRLLSQSVLSINAGGLQGGTVSNMQHKARSVLLEPLKRLREDYKRDRGLEQIWEIARQCLLLVGIIFSIYGYFGCFVLVQESQDGSLAPITWLLLELALTIARSIIWASDPEFDEATSILLSCKETRQHSLPSGAQFIEGESKELPLKMVDAMRCRIPNWKPLTFPDHSISVYYTVSADPHDPAGRVLHLVIDVGERVEVFHMDKDRLSVFRDATVETHSGVKTVVKVPGSAVSRNSSALVDEATVGMMRAYYLDCYAVPWTDQITEELKWNLTRKLPKTAQLTAQMYKSHRRANPNTSPDESDNDSS